MALTAEQVEKLRGTLGSLGWQDVIKPVLANTGKTVITALLDPGSARDGEFKNMSDDYLRGMFAGYQRVLTFFEAEVETERINRLRDDDRRKQEGTPVGSPYGGNGGEPTG
jgi:hypothetical protein